MEIASILLLTSTLVLCIAFTLHARKAVKIAAKIIQPIQPIQPVAGTNTGDQTMSHTPPLQRPTPLANRVMSEGRVLLGSYSVVNRNGEKFQYVFDSFDGQAAVNLLLSGDLALSLDVQRQALRSSYGDEEAYLRFVKNSMDKFFMERGQLLTSMNASFLTRAYTFCVVHHDARSSSEDRLSTELVVRTFEFVEEMLRNSLEHRSPNATRKDKISPPEQAVLNRFDRVALRQKPGEPQQSPSKRRIIFRKDTTE